VAEQIHAHGIAGTAIIENEIRFILMPVAFIGDVRLVIRPPSHLDGV